MNEQFQSRQSDLIERVAPVDASESATSHQLRQLGLAGLVRSRKEGRAVYYKVDDTHVRLLLDIAVVHYLHGQLHGQEDRV